LAGAPLPAVPLAVGGVGDAGGAGRVVRRRALGGGCRSGPWGWWPGPYGVEERFELAPYEVVVLAYEVDEPVSPVVHGWFDLTWSRHEFTTPHGTKF